LDIFRFLPYGARFTLALQCPWVTKKRCSNQKYICVCFLFDLEPVLHFFAKSAVGKNIVPWYTTVSIDKKTGFY